MANQIIKKKDTLIFFGSPKINGNTAKVTKQLIKLGRKHFNFKVVNSYILNIRPCYDCGYCKLHNICKFKDFDRLDLLIKKAKVIVISSPIYNCGFPAPLKLILDRFQPYFYSQQKLSKKDFEGNKKKALLILTSGRKEEKSGISSVYLQAKYSLKSINASIVKTINFTNTDIYPIEFNEQNGNDLLLKSALKSIF